MGLVLPAHVHACLANDHVVFLDEDADLYLAAAPDLTPVLRRLVDGTGTDEDEAMAMAVLSPPGLLIDTGLSADRLKFAFRSPPTTSSAEDPAPLRASPALFHALLFRGWWALKVRTSRPSRYFPYLRRLKSKFVPGSSLRPTLDLAIREAEPMLATRWLLPTHDLCLPWSMAMTSFLSWKGIPADLVIGVKSKPFGAHAWVQYQDTVLSDALDHVTPYTPILAI
jgi:hypothetical protein